jgi:Protein of unknown function (DUF4230)
MDVLAALLGAAVALVIGVAAGWWFSKQRARAARTELRSDLQELRDIGELSVFKVVTKDILTHSDHSFGEIGRKYLSWAFTQKKLAMIFEFEVDFRFDLRSNALQIRTDSDPQGGRRASIVMPLARYDVRLKDVSFYDEQRARLLPWLLPDLVSSFLPGGFNEEDKNRLIAAARAHAESQAALLSERYRHEIETSARQTLTSVTRSLGFAVTQVQFAPAESVAAGATILEFPRATSR